MRAPFDTGMFRLQWLNERLFLIFPTWSRPADPILLEIRWLNFVALIEIMNDPILVITDIVMVQNSLIVMFQKQSHDITHTTPQIA